MSKFCFERAEAFGNYMNEQKVRDKKRHQKGLVTLVYFFFGRVGETWIW